MFCYFCGKENDDAQKFCKYCGNSLRPTKQDENRPVEPKKEEITEQPQQLAESGDNTAPSKYIAPDMKTEPSGSETIDSRSVSNKLLAAVIVLLALILAALGLCLFVYIRSGAANPLEMFGARNKQMEAEERTDVNEDYTDNADEEALLTEEPYEETKDMAADTSGNDETEAAEVTEPKDDRDAMKSDKADQTAEDNTDNKQTAAYEKEGSYSADKQADDGFYQSADKAELTQEKLKISFAEASSVLNAASKDHATYVAGNVCDGNYKTAWVEGVAGNGEGQILALHLDGVHKISRIKIYNGFLKTKRRYAINGRVTSAVIDYGSGYQQAVDLKAMNPPEVEIEFAEAEMGETEIVPEIPCETDTISITLTGVQPGSKYTDTAISEIEVYGD
ncbi:MAG: hypothetical protein K6G27_02550 [Lachnospiraceae bacterium]|nr:hypothetical protein [Lachnospiraceae bacterium]